MKPQRLILALLVLTFAFAPQSPRSAFAEPTLGQYHANLISPKAGAIVMPGTVVRIAWTATFPRVDLTMCETEVMLSVDGGRTFTFVTSQRDPNVHYVDWIVPRTPTRNAVLDVRFGCLGLYPETRSIQSQSTFIISDMN